MIMRRFVLIFILCSVMIFYFYINMYVSFFFSFLTIWSTPSFPADPLSRIQCVRNVVHVRSDIISSDNDPNALGPKLSKRIS